MTQLNIDLSYKDGAVATTYDIETVYDLFTIALMNKGALSFIFFGNEKFDHLTDMELQRQMKEFMKKGTRLKDFGIENIDDLDYHLYRYYSTPQDMKALSQVLLHMITCKPLPKENKNIFNHHKFVEYGGWNSSSYDLSMLVLIKLLIDAKNGQIEPHDIRHLSDLLIGFNGPPWMFPDYIQTETAGAIKAFEYKQTLHLALWSDGHIDWAKLARAVEEDKEQLMPPGLKKEMAKFGLDIIMDDKVSSSEPMDWSDEDLAHLVEYNFNDIFGTHIVSQNDVLQAGLYTRDVVRKMYPYATARNTPINKLGYWVPPERDVTPANLSGLVLIGPKRIKPIDYHEVSYIFPVPINGSRTEFMQVDLLEYIKEKEKFIHPYWTKFFSHFRGKDTTTYEQDAKVKATQPVTSGQMCNIPYYRDGKPLDTYIRISTGGAHGSVMAGLSEMTPEEINQWITLDAGAKGKNKPTIDVRNIIHADFSSFYPVMASKMGLYQTQEGIDRFTDMIQYRITAKETLPHDPSTWTDEDITLNENQLGLKLILNSATGAGNMHKEYALLPLDNKTLSMRLIGNMLIWVLAQRFSEAGGYVISTNTDGIYLCNLTVEEAQAVIDDYIDDYGMGVDPEPMARFINRDVSNRVEYYSDPKVRTKVNGILTHGSSLEFPAYALGKNVSYPLIAANAALEYMNQDDWLTKPYDRSFIKDYITKIAKDESLFTPWYHIYAGTKSRRLFADGKLQQPINRLIFTKTGSHIYNEINSQLTKSDSYEIYTQLINGVIDARKLKINNEPVKWADTLEKYPYIDFTQIDLVKNKKSYGRTTYYPVNMPKTHYKDFNEFSELMQNLGARTLGIYDKDAEAWVPLQAWKVGAITGYTSNTAMVLNAQEELEQFDHDLLDIDAYVRWAENILSTWKVTADIPEIGLKSVDDTVITKMVTHVIDSPLLSFNIYKQIMEGTPLNKCLDSNGEIIKWNNHFVNRSYTLSFLKIDENNDFTALGLGEIELKTGPDMFSDFIKACEDKGIKALGIRYINMDNQMPDSYEFLEYDAERTGETRQTKKGVQEDLLRMVFINNIERIIERNS